MINHDEYYKCGVFAVKDKADLNIDRAKYIARIDKELERIQKQLENTLQENKSPEKNIIAASIPGDKNNEVIIAFEGKDYDICIHNKSTNEYTRIITYDHIDGILDAMRHLTLFTDITLDLLLNKDRKPVYLANERINYFKNHNLNNNTVRGSPTKVLMEREIEQRR